MIMGNNRKAHSTTSQEDKTEQESLIIRPAGVDTDWDVRIQRAREAREAGKRLREDQPVLPPTQYAPNA